MKQLYPDANEDEITKRAASKWMTLSETARSAFPFARLEQQATNQRQRQPHHHQRQRQRQSNHQHDNQHQHQQHRHTGSSNDNTNNTNNADTGKKRTSKYERAPYLAPSNIISQARQHGPKILQLCRERDRERLASRDSDGNWTTTRTNPNATGSRRFAQVDSGGHVRLCVHVS